MANDTTARTAGFTLIELSIWITILAVLAASLLSFMTPPAVEEMEKIKLTQRNMRIVMDALIDFRATNNRLPCPALRNITDAAPQAYSEDCTGVTVGAVRHNLGAVPARTLGIAEEYALDGWGRRLTYHVSSEVCEPGPAGNQHLPTNCTEGHYRCVNPASSTCVTPAGNLVVRSTGANGGIILSDAVFVLVSHGANGFGAFNRAGVQLPLGGTTNAHEVQNYTIAGSTAPLEYSSEQYGMRPSAGESIYDDFVMYRSRQQIEFEVLDPAKLVLGENVAFRNTPEGAGKNIFCFDFVPGNPSVANTPGVIDSVEEALAAYTLATHNAVNQLVSSTGVAFSTMSDSPPSNRVLSFLWNIQEACHYYYPASGRLAGGRVCPPGNTGGAPRAFHEESHACRCPDVSAVTKRQWQPNGANYGCL